MADYVCPQYIWRLFQTTDDAVKEIARQMAAKWAASLPLAPGDLVWLPELGWCINRGDGDGDKSVYRITVH